VGKRGVTRDDSVKFTKAAAQGGDENSFRALTPQFASFGAAPPPVSDGLTPFLNSVTASGGSLGPETSIPLALG
jgi:hypothetical protein